MKALPARRHYKDRVYREFARVVKALANPTRLELVDLLAQGPRTVERLARESGQSVANTSQHLQVLRGARLVEGEKVGLFVTYRLADPGVTDAFLAVRALAETRIAEIERLTREFLQSRGLFEPIDREALVARVARGEVTVLDVRPAEEYRAGHIPGAISVPLADLERRLAELPRTREIVAYCRGPYCVFAYQAVELLRAQGLQARRLQGGFPEWRAAGLPVEIGARS